MRIIDRFSRGEPVFSFEFSPPKTDVGLQKLYSTIEYLAELNPDFVSLTYGAGGSTRGLSVQVSDKIKNSFGIEPMAHLTCVGHPREEIDEIICQLKDVGVENVMALRGDPPRDQPNFQRAENGFGYASELIEFLVERHDICIGGACYPEGHIENADPKADLGHLVRKVSAGATFLVTQLFFDNQLYFDFVEQARGIGITVPIVPGIMPITNVEQVERFTTMCGATIPEDLMKRLDRFRTDEQAVTATGIEWATRQCRELLDHGAPGIHFYTLNKSLATRVIYGNVRGLSVH